MTAVRMDQLGELRPQLTASLLAAQGAVRPLALDVCGQVSRVSGTTIEAEGLIAPIGAQCAIAALASDSRIEADVIGFSDQKLILMPYGGTAGLGPGDRVHVTARQSLGRLSNALVGRVIDGFGNPLDRAEPVPYEREAHLDGIPVNPMERPPINSVLDTGIKAINTALTIGRGQRIGLMAGSGVGKSMLLGMLTRHTAADVVVIGMIGERGREVQDFIQNILGAEGMARAVVIAAPANSSPVARLKAAKLAHLVSEDFRDQGRHVLLLLDSLTRVAHAQREIGLAMGEPPTSKGYPPSVFSLFPQLIERPGVGRGGHGSITSFYTVLAEGDDQNDPIVDIARASLDGQVILSRKLADAAHYPAIDLNGSISRVMQNLLNPDDMKLANKFRRLWSLYQQNQDLIQVGAYEAGTNPQLDEAIALRERMEAFLCQGMHEGLDEPSSRDQLRALLST